MNEEYPLTQSEYAKIVGISKEGLRSRRRSGKLEGEYVLKDNQYFFKRVGPNLKRTTPKKHTKPRRRGVHLSGGQTKYTSNALRLHNEAKMLARLQRNLDQETLDLLPDAIERAKKAKEQRITATRKSVSEPKRIYSFGMYNPKYATPKWKSLEEKKTERKFAYY
jgi:hypothetical protein|tara:strand:- start:118 stop:612 length:495 start_codon:yes stop_codon:yes gene_type:complete